MKLTEHRKDFNKRWNIPSFNTSDSETINRNKNYRIGERIVSKALQSFALKLFSVTFTVFSHKKLEIYKL